MSVFPIKSKGQHPQLVNEANTDSLTLRPVASPLQNLQPPITQRLLCGTTEVNEKFLGQDFNLLDKLPVTAYDLTPLFHSWLVDVQLWLMHYSGIRKCPPKVSSLVSNLISATSRSNS